VPAHGAIELAKDKRFATRGAIELAKDKRFATRGAIELVKDKRFTDSPCGSVNCRSNQAEFSRGKRAGLNFVDHERVEKSLP